MYIDRNNENIYLDESSASRDGKVTNTAAIEVTVIQLNIIYIHCMVSKNKTQALWGRECGNI